MMQEVVLSKELIIQLTVLGYNGFYLEGCHDSNKYILFPTVIEHIVQGDELSFELFERVKLFNETEVLEMIEGDEFIHFVVRLPDKLEAVKMNEN